MVLYKIQKTKSRPSGYRFSYDSPLLLLYCSFASFQLYGIMLLNSKFKFMAQDGVGLLLALTLIITSLLAAFRKEKVYLFIGSVASIALILAALLGVSKDDIGAIYFDSLIWLDPSLAFNSLIGHSFIAGDPLVALKASYIINLLPCLSIFVIVYLYRRIVGGVAT